VTLLHLLQLALLYPLLQFASFYTLLYCLFLNEASNISLWAILSYLLETLLFSWKSKLLNGWKLLNDVFKIWRFKDFSVISQQILKSI